MKKLLIACVVLTLTTGLTSCSETSLTDDDEKTEFATGHGDSTNSGSTDDPEPDNGED